MIPSSGRGRGGRGGHGGHGGRGGRGGPSTSAPAAPIVPNVQSPSQFPPLGAVSQTVSTTAPPAPAAAAAAAAAAPLQRRLVDIELVATDVRSSEPHNEQRPHLTHANAVVTTGSPDLTRFTPHMRPGDQIMAGDVVFGVQLPLHSSVVSVDYTAGTARLSKYATATSACTLSVEKVFQVDFRIGPDQQSRAGSVHDRTMTLEVPFSEIIEMPMRLCNATVVVYTRVGRSSVLTPSTGFCPYPVTMGNPKSSNKLHYWLCTHHYEEYCKLEGVHQAAKRFVQQDSSGTLSNNEYYQYCCNLDDAAIISLIRNANTHPLFYGLDRELQLRAEIQTKYFMKKGSSDGHMNQCRRIIDIINRVIDITRAEEATNPVLRTFRDNLLRHSYPAPTINPTILLSGGCDMSGGVRLESVASDIREEVEELINHLMFNTEYMPRAGRQQKVDRLNELLANYGFKFQTSFHLKLRRYMRLIHEALSELNDIYNAREDGWEIRHHDLIMITLPLFMELKETVSLCYSWLVYHHHPDIDESLIRSAWSYYSAARLTIAYFDYYNKRFGEGVDARDNIWITWDRLHADGVDQEALNFLQTECPMIYHTSMHLYRESQEDGSISQCTEEWVRIFDSENDEQDLPEAYILPASAWSEGVEAPKMDELRRESSSEEPWVLQTPILSAQSSASAYTTSYSAETSVGSSDDA